MGDYEQLEQQLRQTREHVDRLSLSEKNKLRPVPVERTFNWSLFASAVGAVSFVLLIGLFARIGFNPAGEVAVTALVEHEATGEMSTQIIAEADLGTEENPQTDLLSIRNTLDALAQRNRDAFDVEGWMYVESEHFTSNGDGLEKDRERQYWVALDENKEPEHIIWRNLFGSHLYDEGVYRPNQPSRDSDENLAAIAAIIWNVEMFLRDDAAMVGAFTKLDEEGNMRYVIVQGFLTSVQQYEFDYASGHILRIENRDDIGQEIRAVYSAPRNVTTLPASASLLFSMMNATSSADDASRIIVDLFSGRPNPTWTLDPEPSQELFDTLGIAIRTAGHSRFENLGLGYRGIVVRRGDITLRFLNGRVQMEQPSLSAVFFRDDDFALRDWVLETGEISAEIRTAICSAEYSPALCSDS